MDIKGFGTVYIEELVRLGYINNVADVFVLKTHRDELIDQGIIGKEKNTDKLWDSECGKGSCKSDHEVF